MKLGEGIIIMSDELDYSKPFKVVILEDCRTGFNGYLTQKKGVCLGLYELPDELSTPPDLSKRISLEERNKRQNSGLEKLANPETNEDEDIDLGGSPLILTYNGDYIWGMECYWRKTKDISDVPEGLWLLIPEAFRDDLRTGFYFSGEED